MTKHPGSLDRWKDSAREVFQRTSAFEKRERNKEKVALEMSEQWIAEQIADEQWESPALGLVRGALHAAPNEEELDRWFAALAPIQRWPEEDALRERGHALHIHDYEQSGLMTEECCNCVGGVGVTESDEEEENQSWTREKAESNRLITDWRFLHWNGPSLTCKLVAMMTNLIIEKQWDSR